jgi:hypothetical protein
VRLVIASSARKHGIGKTRIIELLANHDEVIDVTRPGDSDPKICFLAHDLEHREWEVIAVVLPAMLLVIHAMPTHFRPTHFSWSNP